MWVSQLLSQDATLLSLLPFLKLLFESMTSAGGLTSILKLKTFHFSDYFTVTSFDDTSISSAYKSQTPRFDPFSRETLTICSKFGRSFL